MKKIKAIAWLITIIVLATSPSFAASNTKYDVKGCALSVEAQNDYHMQQARQYQREAEYYTKQAQGYDRCVCYYNRQAQGYLREAEYYSKREKYDQVRTCLRRAKNAIYSVDLYKQKADNARERAQSYTKRAEDALQKVK